MKVLAMMGIRAGSKGYPDKNITNLCGYPLFTWSASAAKRSKYINRLIISTDSPEYQQIIHHHGFEAPYLRPSYLANDTSPEFYFVRDLLDTLAVKEDYIPDFCVRILATVPMQLHYEIDIGIKYLMTNQEADSAVVVSESRQHPRKSLEISDSGQMCFPYGMSQQYSELVTPLGRSSYKKSYHRSNVIIFRTSTISRTESLTGKFCYPVIIDQLRAIDIDTEVDMWCADAIMKRLSWSTEYPNLSIHTA
ncbi:hypothetical protein OAE36_00010 [bacterium]|nr:hypothetical protein [bacterium]